MKGSAWLKQLPANYLRCRSLRHAWEITGYTAVDPPNTSRKRGLNQFVGRHMVCEHCAVNRIDVFGRRRSGDNLGVFRKLVTRYSYPSGYVWDKREVFGKRPAFSDFDHESLRRALPADLQ